MHQHSIYLCKSSHIIFLIYPAQDTVMPKTLVIRIIAQSKGIVFYCLIIFLLIDTAKSSQLVTAYHIRITLYCLRAVALSPTEIIEIELCHPSKEPRFIKIGFCTYCLIEILSVTGLQPDGFPHSDMLGSKPVCSSPSLFAAYHVFHRLRIA